MPDVSGASCRFIQDKYLPVSLNCITDVMGCDKHVKKKCVFVIIERYAEVRNHQRQQLKKLKFLPEFAHLSTLSYLYLLQLFHHFGRDCIPQWSYFGEYDGRPQWGLPLMSWPKQILIQNLLWHLSIILATGAERACKAGCHVASTASWAESRKSRHWLPRSKRLLWGVWQHKVFPVCSFVD